MQESKCDCASFFRSWIYISTRRLEIGVLSITNKRAGSIIILYLKGLVTGTIQFQLRWSR